MTSVPTPEFTVVVLDEPPTLTVRPVGELDYDTCDDLVRTVAGRLAGASGPREVRLDCAELTMVDSAGLSALLMIHRHTRAADARLHLDNRPRFLERLLHLTGVLGHLTAPPAALSPGADDTAGGTEADAT